MIKKKIIPENIADWLSPRVLVFWSMDDGNSSESGFYLNTLSYTLEEHPYFTKSFTR